MGYSINKYSIFVFISNSHYKKNIYWHKIEETKY